MIPKWDKFGIYSTESKISNRNKHMLLCPSIN